MKRSKIGLIVIASLILNTLLMFQPAGVSQVEAAFPGYNGKIALLGSQVGNDIYTIRSNGADQVWLTSAAFNDERAQWSPDGTMIAFQSARDGNQEIYTMNADGSSQTRLTNAAGNDDYALWSPDGTQIAFVSRRDGNAEIYIMDADGSNQTRLTNNSALDWLHGWSPDGSKIAFGSMRDSNFEIYIMDADGSNQTRLTNDAGTDNGAQWSPDGTAIAFASDRDGNFEVYVMNADGSDQTRLTNKPAFWASDYTIRWSPDGQTIAVGRMDADWESAALVLVAADGSGEQEFDYLASGIVIIDWITYSPDGKKILITGYHEDTWDTWDQYVVDADGSNLVQLTNDGESGYGVWQPIPNTAPVLASKATSLMSGTSSLIDVLSGSTDEETLSGSNVTITTPPSHGSAIVESGKIKYTADADYAGSDSLIYEVCDSFMLDQRCSTKTLNLTVKPSLGLAKIGTTQTTGSTKVETTNTKPTFSGTTTPLATVTVEIHSDPIILTTTADAEGNWSVTPDEPLPPGEHTVYISSTLNGQTTELDSFVLGISETIPNTGASTLFWRYGGLGLVLMGAASFILYRRQRPSIHISLTRPIKY